MKKSILMSITLFLIFGASALAQDRVTLYKDCDFRGDRHPLYEGEYHDNELGIGNDQLSSIQIPYGFSVTVYTSGGFSGRSETFTSDVRCMPKEFNDNVSSIVVSKSSSYSYRHKDNAYHNSSYENPDMVTVYRDSDFRGSSQWLSAGYHNANSMGVGNNQISSIRIPNGWSVTVYVDSDYRGRSKTFTQNVSQLHDFNDEISSILITKLDNHSYSSSPKYKPRESNNSYDTGMVTIFSDSNYRGQNKSLGAGYHNHDGLGSVGNDRTSSIRVPYGWSVTVYSSGDYKGKSRTFTHDVSDLYDFNDEISSIYVSKQR